MSPTTGSASARIPHSDLRHLGDVVETGDEQTALLRDGMEVLVGYLGNVRDGV
jgi:hypothetical protein